MELTTIITVLGFIAPIVIWAIRQEGRINRNKDLMEDLSKQYEKDLIDQKVAFEDRLSIHDNKCISKFNLIEEKIKNIESIQDHLTRSGEDIKKSMSGFVQMMSEVKVSIDFIKDTIKELKDDMKR